MRQEARSAERATGTRRNTPADLNRRAHAAAEALGKARAAHERRPDDAGAYRAFLEARVEWLETQLALRDRKLAAEQRRSLALGRRLRAARALLATAARPGRRRRAGAVGDAPLFEGVGA